MVSTLLILLLVISVSAGNLALGYGLALHFGHGPKSGWAALFHFKPALPAAAIEATEAVHEPATELPPASKSH